MRRGSGTPALAARAATEPDEAARISVFGQVRRPAMAGAPAAGPCRRVRAGVHGKTAGGSCARPARRPASRSTG